MSTAVAAPPGLAASFQVKTLREALAAVAPAMPSKSPNPVLQNILLVVHQDGSAEVQATNLEFAVRFTFGVEDPITCEPGACLLPPRVVKLVGEFSAAATIRFDLEGGTLRIESGLHRSKVPTDDPELFPRIPSLDGVPEFASVDGGDFAQAIKQASPATDVDSTRYALGGCLIAAEGGSLAMVATNGRMLVRRVMQANLAEPPAAADEPDGRASADRPAGVAPVPALKRVAALADPDSSLVVRADAYTMAFEGPGWFVWTRKVEGRFPRYQDVFPTKPAVVTAAVDRDALAAAVARVAEIAVTDESRGIDFHFHGVLDLSAAAADAGSAAEPVDFVGDPSGVADGTGDAGPVTLSHDYLPIVLGSGPEVLTWSVIDHKSAVVVADPASGYTAVIMPLTRDR